MPFPARESLRAMLDVSLDAEPADSLQAVAAEPALQALRIKNINLAATLLRIATLWNIPVASNRTTADMIVTSPLFTGSYTPSRPAFLRSTESPITTAG